MVLRTFLGLTGQMMNMEYNKYKIPISNKLLINYYNNLIKDFFKILPIFEGRDARTKLVIYSPEESYIQYNKYISNFILEIKGAYILFNDNPYFLKLLNILEGMLNSKIIEHAEIKSLVFHCIDIIKKLIEEVSEDGL